MLVHDIFELRRFVPDKDKQNPYKTNNKLYKDNHLVNFIQKSIPLVYNNSQLYQGRIFQDNNHLEDYTIVH
jgi:hypothetical protein